MAFSESFEIGNSTLKDLEGAVSFNENSRQGLSSLSNTGEILEIVDESPTYKSNKAKNRLHISRKRNPLNRKRGAFQKSKSDSMLNENSSLNIYNSEIVSDFFKSDISFDKYLNEQNEKSNKSSFQNKDLVDVANESKCSNMLRRKEVQKVADTLVKIDLDVDKNKNMIFSDFDIFSDSFQNDIKMKEKFSEPMFDDRTFELDILHVTQNPSFVFVKENSQAGASILAKELENSKKDLSLLEEEEQEIFLNLTSKLENLSTSEKPLLHFSISSEDDLEQEEAEFTSRKSSRENVCKLDSTDRTVNQSNIETQKSVKNHKCISITTQSVLNTKRDEGIIEKSIDQNNLQNDISKWNLPLIILGEYKKKGIKTLFDWQVECLSNSKVLLEYKNLVYSAPTSAGKTLVSEIIAIKNILERNKKVIFILPFVSVVREKMFYLQDLLCSSGYRVEGFFGGYSPPGGFDSINLAICTIEKANSIINRLLEQGKLENVGCIIIDEIHLISDPGRGYILELLLTKILYMSNKLNYQIQIVTMSATLSNCETLTDWLNAELYVTNFRPVELNEMIKIGKKIYDNKLNLVRTIDSSTIHEIQNDQDEIAFLCIETILKGCSVIIFCPSKDWCENLSQNLSKNIKKLCDSNTNIGLNILKIINKETLSKVKDQLKALPTGCDKILENTCEYGCAFHHAGLTTEERDFVENNFKNGLLKIIVATSTLSSGVNLPARRVIIRSPLFGGKPMDSLTYKQMIGRAGRTGKDTLGESILICNENNAKVGKDLLRSNLKPISSCLDYDKGLHLKRALLEVISSGVAKTHIDLDFFLRCTLYSVTKHDRFTGKQLDEYQKSFDPIKESINFLMEFEFIRVQKDNENGEVYYVPSRLGMACLASSLPPTDGIILFSELQRSRKCFVLESELHAVYLVTPYSVCYQLQNIDWLHYLDIWERLSPGMKKVAEIVGIKESFLVRAMRCQNKLDFKLLQIHKRFYIALALQELVNEVPISTVANKFKCNRGLLQSLQQMSSTFASIVTSFCNALNWKTLALIVSQFKERLYFGVHRDLIDLMKLPDINSYKARVLFNAGIETLVDLANSSIFAIEKILYDSLSFESSKKQEDEDDYEAKKRNAVWKIYVTGKVNMTIKEAAQMLIKDARKFLQYEIGVKCDWNDSGNLKETIVTDGIHDGANDDKFTEVVEQGLTLKRKSNRDELEISCSPPKVEKNFEENKNIDLKMDETQKTLNTEKPLKKTINNGNENSLPIRRSPRNHRSSSKGISAINDENPKSKNISDLPNSNNNLKELANTSDLPTRIKTQKLSTVIHKEDSNPPFKKDNRENIKTQMADTSSILISDISNESIIKSPGLINNLADNHSIIVEEICKKHISMIDLSDNFESYNTILNKILKTKDVGFSIAIERLPLTNQQKTVIGANILHKTTTENQISCSKNFIIDNKYFITGMSLSYEEESALFIALDGETDSILQHKLNFLKNIFSYNDLTLRIFDSKEHLKILEKYILKNNKLNTSIEDPKIANWLLNPDKDFNIKKLVFEYVPKYSSLLEEIQLITNHKGYISLGLNYNSPISGKKRACYDAYIATKILKEQLQNLGNFTEGQMKKFFYELEMPIQKVLAHCEVIGISINSSRLQELLKRLFDAMKCLEKKIYQLHGSHFNLASSSAVARILGLYKKANGKVSTSKQILERIDSPMANLILNYRKVNTVLTKNIQPLQKLIQRDKIHGNSITISSTGRISMHEPNIQNIAKDFEFSLDDKIVKISCRSIFSCPSDRYLLSADFCQLEMRVLTHLSQDESLKIAIESGKDIFISIAAKWNGLPEEKISDEVRNGTKQICYGIIYGMGIKALSENLKCTEQEALSMSEQFHIAYPGIRAYIQKVVRFARQNGFVETITGRRRYLEHINSTETSLKSQAERQAVNSTIQGSAADIAKSAILRMEKNIIKYKSKLGVNVPNNEKSQVELVLHLHDELMYEVPEEKVRNVAKILKATMENCVKLNVPLKVKLKAGSSWGEMVDLIL